MKEYEYRDNLGNPIDYYEVVNDANKMLKEIEEKDKEIERLNNIINGLEKSIQEEIDRTKDLIQEDSSMVGINNIRRMLNDTRQCILFDIKKLKEGR